MRALCLLLLVLFIAVIGIFAYQNQGVVTLTFWDRNLNLSLALVIAGAYLLGMLSGWTVIGMLRRTVDRVIERPLPPTR